MSRPVPTPPAIERPIPAIVPGMGNPAPAMALPDGGDAALLREAGIRIEATFEGPFHGGVIALPATPDRHVLVALFREGGGTWRAFRGLVPSRGLDVRWETLSRRAGRKRVTAARLDGLGILSGDPARPIADAHACLRGSGPPGFADLMRVVAVLAEPDGGHDAPASDEAWRMAGLHRADSRTPGTDRDGFDGYRSTRFEPSAIALTTPSRAGFPETLPGDAALAAMGRAIAAWVAAMSDAILGPVARLGLAPVWSWRLNGWLLDPEHGTRRRQAVSLHPAFAPVMFRDEATGTAIDAGRPFEAELAKAIAGWRAMDGLPVPGPALMRRFRSLPQRLLAGDIASLVAMASTMPIDRVPATPAAWFLMASHARSAFPLVRGRRTADDRHWAADLAELVRHPPPLPLSHLLPDAGVPHLDDLVDQVARHLVRPVVAGAGIRPTNPGTRAIARALLVRGERADRIRERCARWHAEVLRGYDRAESLPDDTTWPALFPDFAASNGVSIACLVTARALREEGSDQVDAGGADGLAHCVGTYAPRCLEGEVHVASVRSGGRRLSTLSLVPDRGRDGVAIEQHRGLANGDPPPEAKAAVAELMRRFERDPPVPAVAPDLGSVVIGRDAPAPNRLDHVLGLWLPLMPKALRRAGLDALRTRILALADGFDVHP